MFYRMSLALALIFFSLGAFANSDSWLLSNDNFIAAKMPMVVVHPRPDIEAKLWSRHKKAYPNGIIEYRVPIVIQGGAFPFKYEILDAPVGMSIGETIADGNYGILTWKPNSAVDSQNVTIQ